MIDPEPRKNFNLGESVIAGTDLEGRSGKPTPPDPQDRLSATSEHIDSPKDLGQRIQDYLGNGGLFNPELMEHQKVRDLLLDVLTHLRQQQAQPTRAVPFDSLVDHVYDGHCCPQCGVVLPCFAHQISRQQQGQQPSTDKRGTAELTGSVALPPFVLDPAHGGQPSVPNGEDSGHLDGLRQFLEAIVLHQGCNDHVWLIAQATEQLKRLAALRKSPSNFNSDDSIKAVETDRATLRQQQAETQQASGEILQAVLDAIEGTIDTSTQIAGDTRDKLNRQNLGTWTNLAQKLKSRKQ